MRDRVRHGRLGRVISACLLAWVVVAAAAPAFADGRTDYLIRLLKTSNTFRVRAQAALSLGHVENHPEVVRALATALSDEHPAVRTAAAASLESLGNPSALSALQRASQDHDSTVRRQVSHAIRALERIARTHPHTSPVPSSPGNAGGGAARYYVGVGMPGTRANVDHDTLVRARQMIADTLQRIGGVVLAPDHESTRAARQVLRHRRLTGYYVDSSIVQVQDTGSGTRAVVSVILNTYPGRDLRAMLQGAARVSGGQGPEVARQAIEAAFEGALRRLPQALAAADTRASAP